jgi:hypothetical protein
MDLRRIVEEVEERKREQLAYAPPPRARPAGGASGGLRASILETVRDRMLREDPSADVSSLNQVIEPARSTPPPSAPHAKFAAEPAAATIAREAARSVEQAAPAHGHSRKTRDDFLARYLVMSEEFEKRYKVKGWTDTVRKKCSSGLRP